METECKLCDLHIERTQIVYATPPPAGGLLAIGEAPGEKEDLCGQGFAGIAGKNLDNALLSMGVSRSGYGRANICRCRPPGNRKPSKIEVEACLPHLHDLLRSSRTKVVLAVGGTPSGVFYEGKSLTEILERAKRRGYRADAEWSQEVFVVPMPHTSPLAWNRRAADGRPWREIGMRQIQIALSLLGEKEGAD